MAYEPKQQAQHVAASNNSLSVDAGFEQQPASSSFTSAGAIPPIQSTFNTERPPSASELAFGPGNSGTNAVPATASTARKTPNPTYIDARFYAGKYFRRHGELAHLLSQACRDGLHAFSIRSSEEYNKSDSMGLLLLKFALEAVPAGGALLQTLHELTTNEKLRELTGLVSALKKTAESLETVHHKVEKVEKATERITKGVDAVEKKHEVSDAGEAKEKGDFELETVSTLAELLSDSVANRWQSEDQIDELLEQLEYTDTSINLNAMVQKVLGPLPDPSAVKGAVSDAAQQFELQLYLQYYVETGKASYVTEEQDGATRVYFEGLPHSVIGRFDELGKRSLLVDHPKMKKRHVVRWWSGNRI